MRRPIVLALLATSACARFTTAYVEVKEPTQVALERTTPQGPETLVPAGPATFEATRKEPFLGLVDDHATRNADGSLVLTRDLSTRRLVVVDEHGTIRIAPRDLPDRNAPVFWALFSPYAGFGSLAVATPWSNVKEVTLKTEKSSALAWLEIFVGGANAAGGAYLAVEGYLHRDDRSHFVRDLGYVGAFDAVLGAIFFACGVDTLLTPDESWTWAPSL